MNTKPVLVVFLFALLVRGLLSPLARAESVEETIVSLERAIRELQDAVDTLEGYRTGLEDEDLGHVLAEVRHARRTMRLTGCSLLMHSVDIRRTGDLERVVSTLKALEPEIYNRPARANTSPPPKPSVKPVR